MHDSSVLGVAEYPRTSDGIALRLESLRVEAPSGTPIIEDVSLQLEPGKILGVVGESGSGKTTTALALLGYTQGGARITQGEISIDGVEVDISRDAAVRALRGKAISYVPQNPGTALNPSLRIGAAITDMVHAHRTGKADTASIGSVLESVGLPPSSEFQSRYPHQLSGGQQQRVCISVALVSEPPIVVLDEPTTGLDVVTQAQILDELTRLCSEQGLAMIYVTHDLAVVAQIADRIAVMYAGNIVEEGPAKQLLSKPKHPYTRGLLRSIPDHLRPGSLAPMPGAAVGIDERPSGCRFATRCELHVPECDTRLPELALVDGTDHRARCIRADEVTPLPRSVSAPSVRVSSTPAPAVLEIVGLRSEHRTRRGTVVAASDISFSLRKGECVALVGESGSGKTTIARTIAGLHPIGGGTLRLDDVALPADARRRSLEQRRRIQIVFQNPTDALNPNQTIGTAIGRPARMLRGLGRKAAEAEVKRMLDLVRLPQTAAGRYPAELSGGERQRVGIARALVAEPTVIVCDEITSALDVSVQAAVLELLAEFRREFGLALLFITHDLGVVANVADEVLVLEKGLICEHGPTHQVLEHPTQEYTKKLLDAAPSISNALDLWDEYEAGEHMGGTS